MPPAHTLIGLIVLLSLAAPSAHAQSGGGFDMTYAAIPSGGGAISGGGFSISATLSQPQAGAMAGGSFTMTAGFQAGRIGCQADWDGNGSLQTTDVAAFVSTWFGSLTAGTLYGDFDANGLIQTADIASFVNTWFTALTGGC